MPKPILPRVVAKAMALVAVLSAVPVLAAAPPNRLGAISGSGRTAVEHTVPGRAKRSSDLGQKPLTDRLASVTLHFNMTSAQQVAVNQLIIDQNDPASPSFHKWLTPEQYGAQFGLSSSDLAKVTSWLTGQGLTVTAVAPSSNFITVSGTVAQVQSAFATSIHNLTLDGEQHFSNVSDPVLPAALTGVVNGITGLNDFRPRSRVHALRVANPHFTSAVSGAHYLAPGDISTIYDTQPLLSSSANGAGITIGVMGQTDISLADVAAFRSASGLAANVPTVRLFGRDPGTSSDDIDEAQLDVEWAGAAAPGATVIYVNSNDVIGSSLVNAITNRVASILTVSYGACESDWGQANLSTLNQYFQQANLQGQTIIGPGGDSGATDCDYQTASASDGLAVDFPASSPFVTGAGGTMFNEGSGTYWNAASGSTDNLNSAVSYIPEVVWNESGSNGLSASGGGASAFFSKPAWQIGAGVPGDLSRDVPDIALSSAASHDGYLYCVQGSCVTGFRNASKNLAVVGGTSVAAPLFAGIMALVEQKLNATTGLGNINPQLYGLANSTYYNNVFHDVTSGNNNSPCIQGSPNCPNGGSIGYTAGPGYDLATGWGSVDAFNLATKWSLVSQAGGSTGIGSVLTSTAVSTTAASCGISGGSLALNIAVSGSATSASAGPTGSVQILVDNAALGSPVALTSGAAAYTLNTGALSSGGHTISAVYLGDATFAGSKGSLLTDVVSSSQPDFAITPCTANTTATAGGTATGVTLTVNPFNGFTGPVTFSASADSSLAASYKFSVSPVTVSSGSGSTTVLTLYAYQSNSSGATGFNRVATTSTPSRPGSLLPAAGGAVALASLLLCFTLPRRRRLTPLLAVLLSVAALGASGCGSGGSSVLASGGGTANSTTAASAGTYVVTVTGVGNTASGTRVHSTQVTLKVQ